MYYQKKSHKIFLNSGRKIVVDNLLDITEHLPDPALLSVQTGLAFKQVAQNVQTPDMSDYQNLQNLFQNLQNLLWLTI